MFSRVQFGKGMVIVYCSETLMYAIMRCGKDMDWWYEEGVMSIGTKKVHMCYTNPRDDVKNRGARSHQDWIISAQLSILCLINGLLDLKDD